MYLDFFCFSCLEKHLQGLPASFWTETEKRMGWGAVEVMGGKKGGETVIGIQKKWKILINK